MSMRIHLIGVCGTAMATLAALLKQQGHEVSGSDQHVYPPMSNFLVREGIALLEGYRSEHVSGALDLVVVGNAISRGNPELEAVLDRRLRYCSLPEAVRDCFLWTRRSIVLAGTHGKTTTTSLTAWLLIDAGAGPTVLVGGIARNLGPEGASYRVGAGDLFVIEGDEYDSAYFDKTAKFLKYLPHVAVIGNIEFDHADIYADMDAVRLAFRRLVQLVPRTGLTLLGADSPEALALGPRALSRVETFGLSADADWCATDLEPGAGTTSFTLVHQGQDLGRFHLPLTGAHNVRNALAAIAASAFVGITPGQMQRSLPGFLGVKRRLEEVGQRRGITVFDDFAHHPTAVDETLKAVRAAWPARRIWAIFEPRSASSCRRVFQEAFAQAFSGADEVVIASVFRSSLPDDDRLSEADLVRDLRQAGVSARHLPDVPSIVDVVAREAQPGDLVVVMSNGGFGGIHGQLLQALG